MRRLVASLLRSIANRLHPEHEITVHIRPDVVGMDDMQESLKTISSLRAGEGTPR